MSKTKTRNFKRIPLGSPELRYPTVRPDGSLTLDGHVPFILSTLSADEITGIALREMPAPEHMPAYLDLLDAIVDGTIRVHTYLSPPGEGKSFLGGHVSRMMVGGDEALVYELGGNKPHTDLLYTTDLAERGEQSVYDRVLQAVSEGRLKSPSIIKLKTVLGEAFDPASASINWDRVVSDQKDIALIEAAFTSVARMEGLDSQSPIAYREKPGVIKQGYDENRPVVVDEFNRGKEITAPALFATLEWLKRRGPRQIAPQSASGRVYELGDLDLSPGFHVVRTGNYDGAGMSETDEAEDSRTAPRELPRMGEAGLTHRFCQFMTGVPLSTLYKLYGPQYENDPQAFVNFCKHVRIYGLDEQKRSKIPVHQLALLERPMEVIEVAKKYAQLWIRWQNKMDVANPSLPVDLMAELTDEFAKKKPTPRLFDDLFKRAIVRAARQFPKTTTAKAGTESEWSSGDLTSRIPIEWIGSALMEVTKEEIENRNRQQPNMRGVIMSDAAELGCLPGRSPNIRTVAQLLNSGAAAEPIVQATQKKGSKEKAPVESSLGGGQRVDLNQLIPGLMVEGQGIFSGFFEPKDKKGKVIGEKGAVFVTPEDLTKTKNILMNYKAGAREVGNIKGLLGHDGAFYENDKEFCKAYLDGSYKEGWVIPPLRILKDQMYQHKDTGAFAGTYVTSSGSGRALVLVVLGEPGRRRFCGRCAVHRRARGLASQGQSSSECPPRSRRETQ